MKKIAPTVFDKVILADSYPVFSSALKRAINGCSSAVEIIEVAHFDEILDHANLCYSPSSTPLLLWDVRLPGSCASLGLAELKARFPRLPVVAIHDGVYHEANQGLLAQRLTGVISRQVDEVLLQRIIKCLLSGDRWLPEQWHSQNAVLTTESRDHLYRLAKLDALSKSQLRVMKRVLRGLMNKQIASELGVTEGTVKVHISNILKAFCVQNRSELIVSLLSPEINQMPQVH